MSHFAVASNFGEERRFFSGVIAFDRERHFEPKHFSSHAGALVLTDGLAAANVSMRLTELCGCFGSAGARTWYVVEIPEPPKHAKPVRPASPSAGGVDA